jgi:hypothetical protein
MASRFCCRSPQPVLCERHRLALLHNHSFANEDCHIAYTCVQVTTQVDTDTECVLEELHI